MDLHISKIYSELKLQKNDLDPNDKISATHVAEKGIGTFLLYLGKPTVPFQVQGISFCIKVEKPFFIKFFLIKFLIIFFIIPTKKA